MSDPEALPPLFDEFPPVSTEDWKAKIQADLGGRNADAVLRWSSIDGVTLPGYLRREDLASISHVEESASVPILAGEAAAPANDWQVRQNLTHPDPSEANRLARRAVERGATGLGLVRPPVHQERAFGLTLNTVSDLQSVLQGIQLDDVSLHLDGGPAAPVLLTALQQIASERDVLSTLSGSVGYDPVGALATGSIRNVDAAFTLADDLVSTDVSSSFRSLTVDLRPYHNAGASAVQELAYGLGALSDLLAYLLEQGHDLRALLPHLQFAVAVSTSYFVEIAKLRALRLLVPQVIEAYASETDQAAEIAPSDLFVQAETSRRTETVYDPYVNMLRGTTEGMAAVIGGCDVLSVRPFDASLHPEEAFSARIARNVQLILREEAHLDVVADPSAGAYYLEAATDQLARRAWDTFQTLESNGGLIDGLREGHVQRTIGEVRTERHEAVDSRERVLVGTNHYPNLEETRQEDLQAPSFVSEEGQAVDLSPPTLDNIRTALSDGHTISSILSALTDERGAAIDPLPQTRVAANIEEVRLRTERYAEETGHTPTVFLAPLGPAKMRSARANFARNVFGVAGFDVIAPLRFETPDEAAEAAAESAPDIVMLCSADSEYPRLTPALKTALADRGHSPLLVVAGNPEKIDADLPADDFIHKGNLLRAKLEAVQQRLGMSMANNPADG